MKDFEAEPYRLFIRNGVYHAYIPLGGYKRIRRSLKTTKRGLARKRLSELIAQADAGEFDNRQVSILLQTWLAEYIDTHLVQRVPESQRRAVKTLKNEIVPFLGDRTKLAEITISQLIKMKTDLWGSKGTPTQNRKVALVKHFFSEAKRRGILVIDPATGLQKKRENPLKSRVLSDIEVQRLVLACAEPLRSFILMGLSTGLRPAELQQICWKHVEADGDAGNYKIHLVNASDLRTKNGKNREIPIHPKVSAALLKLREGRGPDDLIFKPSNGGCCYHHRRAWKNAILRAGLSGGKITLYSLRRSFGSNLQKRGASMLAIRDLYGHATVTMTERYLDTSNAQLRESVEHGMDATVAFLDLDGTTGDAGGQESA